MNRLAIGAALGGLAVYLYDPELGESRRGRLSSLWQENREGVMQAGRTASDTIDSARPLARRIGKAIDRGSWPITIDRGRRAAGLPWLMGAAAVGGAAVYFMDPLKGSVRRSHVLGTGRSAFHKIANLVKPVRGQIGDQVTIAVDRIRSRVS